MSTAEIFEPQRAVPAVAIGAIAASAVVLLPAAGAVALVAALCLIPLAWYVFSVPYRWLAMFFAAALLSLVNAPPSSSAQSTEEFSLM